MDNKRIKLENIDKHIDTNNGDSQRRDHVVANEKKNETTTNNNCPYLGTIDRKALDFDFEKACSISLSKVNVYTCLVCGKYFQGRGQSTHAYTHSLRQFHHVFLNIETSKVYCLPDNYEIKDSSFEDILYLLKPTFDKPLIDSLDRWDKPINTYDGKQYYPGVVGLNNLKHNDYCNVIFQALSHVTIFRNYYLQAYNISTPAAAAHDEKYLIQIRFGELVRKLWNPRNFKAHVSPHEMLQAVVLCSKKKFEFTQQGDPKLFLDWFLNCLLGYKREKSSVVRQAFEGKLRVISRTVLQKDDTSSTEPSDSATIFVPTDNERTDITSFFYLSLDLPPEPLFPKIDLEGAFIKPQVSIYELLSKFDGVSKHVDTSGKEACEKQYQIIKAPPYLIIHMKRFIHNNFFTEKKTHIIDFPLKNLNMTNNIGAKSLGDASEPGGHDSSSFIYNLRANIVHDGDGDGGKGSFRIHLLHKGTNKWFEIQDLYVTEIKDTSLIQSSECYIQVWELKK